MTHMKLGLHGTFFVTLVCILSMVMPPQYAHASSASRALPSLATDSIMDIGVLRIGDDAEISLRVRNTGAATMQVDSVVLVDTRYYRSLVCSTATALPVSVSPADSLDIRCVLRVRHNVQLFAVALVYAHTDCSTIILPQYLQGSASAAGIGYGYTDAVEGTKLFDTLRSRVINHTSLGYKAGREVMFGKADNVNDSVECIYTGKKLKTAGIPPNGEFNTEHSWPQSLGSSSEPNKSDIYHLYPTNPNANSMRANYPFGVVAKVWKDATGGSRLGFTAKGDTVFEPRDASKGNIARGIFYYVVRYGNLFNYYKTPYAMDTDLRAWNVADPPDAQEKKRGDTIAAYQGKRNPFIDVPQFVERLEFVPVQRRLTALVPAAHRVSDAASTSVFFAHAINRSAEARRLTRVEISPEGFIETEIADSLVPAFAARPLRFTLKARTPMPTRFVITAWLSDSTADTSVVTLCGPMQAKESMLPATLATVRPLPARDEAVVEVSATACHVNSVELIDARGMKISELCELCESGELNSDVFTTDGGTFVRVRREVLQGASGVVFVRANVDGVLVTRAVVFE